MLIRLLALGVVTLGACSRGDEPPLVYEDGRATARRLGTLELLRPVTVPDNFILRPDEYGAVGVDPARGLIYVGSREGALLAIDDQTGDVRAERMLDGPVSSPPVLAGSDDDEVLLVGTDNGELVALTPATLSEKWRYATDGRIRSRALMIEGVVYVTNSRDQVFALDARSGKWRWEYEQTLQTDFTVYGHAGLTFVAGGNAAAGEAGTLYACFDNGKVAALATGSGDALWLTSVAPPEGGNFVDCDTTPQVGLGGDRLFVAGQATGVYALAIDDGAVLWQYPVRGTSALVRGPGDTIVAVSALEGVFALDHEGRSLWRTQLDPGSLGEPAVAGDTLLVTHAESGMLAVELSTGNLLGQVYTGSGMSSVPVYDPHRGRVYAISNRGVLVGVRLEAP